MDSPSNMSPSSLRLYLNALGTLTLLLILGFLATKKILQNEKTRLTGIVLLKDHFAQSTGPGGYSGFSIEVLDQLSHLTNLSFHLIDRPWHEARLGPQVDFMIGSLSSISPHPELSFSEPLFEDDNLVAVVSREQAQSLHLCSIHQLIPLTLYKGAKAPLELWSLQGVNHLFELERHNTCAPEPFIRRFPEYIWKHMYLTRNYTDSMSKLRRGKIALLTSLRRAQKMIEAYDCEQFVILRDYLKIALLNVSIYLTNGSPFLEEINEAIRKMKNSGKMQKLVSKNWPEARGECEDSDYPLHCL